MAAYIGKSSNYLFQKNIYYYGKSVSLFLIACILIILAIRFFGNKPYIYIPLMLIIVFPFIDKAKKRSFFTGNGQITMRMGQ